MSSTSSSASTSTSGSTSAVPSTVPPSVKRACDACHRRKVKCDGVSPCRNCSSAQLSCTYNAIPQKKGPKGSRAKVISELRETQRQSTLSTKGNARLYGQNQQCAPSLAPRPGLLTNEMIRECIEFFFTNMYPTLPILHRGRLEQQARFADQDTDTYCLLSSLCAFMMIQPGMPTVSDPLGLESQLGANLRMGTLLMEETVRVRKGYDHLENPTLGSLVTSFFLFGCYFGLELHNKAWFHLREATTLAHILGMQKEDTYLQLDPIESSRRRRLYWLLFVTERSYALQRHRPLSLHATISLPTATDDPMESSLPLAGFIHLVSLFRPFDDMFIALWNKARLDCSPAYLSALQKQLTEALPVYLNSTENQAADLRTSQQWLKTIVWQMSIQNGCLSSGGDDPSMTFQYPVDIARDLLGMTSQFSQHSMEVHGVGLIEKLFDVACSLTDVLSLLPTPADPFVVGPRDYLNQFLGLISTLRNGDNRFLPLLLSKVHDVLPRLASPMLQTIPETPNPCMLDPTVDIFDGFGNAGMGVPSSLPVQFDKRIEDVTSENRQQRDNVPFVGPIVTSPVEYHGMSQYNSFADFNLGMNQQGQQGHEQIPTMPMRQSSITHNFSIMSSGATDFRPMPRDGSGLDDFGLGMPKMDMTQYR